jgi:hypothetical protein
MTAKTYELQWSNICRALRATGHMKDFSKSECLRVNKLLKQQIEKGNVQQVERGRYRLIVDDEGSIDEAVPE